MKRESKYENRKTKMEALFVGLEPPEEVIVSGNEMKISLAYILNYSNELENLRHNVRDVLPKAIELQPSA
ncbi:hypothetical protein AKJ64_00165 [candidate division MSBL1 archaeon SCGC-AAA259E17]|uniref:Uncharacterized protein n=1 Tax=candidate division MSBL1 archaeon SCGC-AAA259E17 TaxID=1698263 RepID=A0A133UHF6_9EURY|nr:hypothetical protein AKJ64_00165 [candidate division MSBL1 archaeon SCGC-AAA259E17]